MAAKKKTTKKTPKKAAKKAAPKKDQNEDVKIENYRRNLPVNLTTEEVAERADRAAQLLKERDHRELEYKEEAKANKRVLARMDADLRELSSEVREHKTYQDVMCERRYNWTQGTVTEIRLDTGEQLSTRPMTEAEAQKALPFEPGEDGDVDEEFASDEGDEGDAGEDASEDDANDSE